MNNEKVEIIKSFKQCVIEGVNRKKTIENHKKRFKLNDDVLSFWDNGALKTLKCIPKRFFLSNKTNVFSKIRFDCKSNLINKQILKKN